MFIEKASGLRRFGLFRSFDVGFSDAVSSLMCLQPVAAPSGIGCQRNVQLAGVLHFFDDNPFHLFPFFRVDREVKLVVYLQNHFRADAFLLEPFPDAYHRHFDDVGLCSLYRRIDGIPFCEAAYGGVAAVDVGQVTSALYPLIGASPFFM